RSQTVLPCGSTSQGLIKWPFLTSARRNDENEQDPDTDVGTYDRCRGGGNSSGAEHTFTLWRQCEGLATGIREHGGERIFAELSRSQTVPRRQSRDSGGFRKRGNVVGESLYGVCGVPGAVQERTGARQADAAAVEGHTRRTVREANGRAAQERRRDEAERRENGPGYAEEDGGHREADGS